MELGDAGYPRVLDAMEGEFKRKRNESYEVFQLLSRKQRIGEPLEESDSESDGQPLELRRIGVKMTLASVPELQPATSGGQGDMDRAIPERTAIEQEAETSTTGARMESGKSKKKTGERSDALRRRRCTEG